MDLYVTFPISGVRTWAFLPPIVAFAVSFLASMGGVSGAFLLLPFQISFLHFVTPSVSATNFVYNIVAIPSGVYRYFREGRMAWHLAWLLVLGTLPGVFLGYYLRVLYLPDPRNFRLFVGCVLLYVGIRLLFETMRQAPDSGDTSQNGFPSLNRTIGIPVNLSAQATIRILSSSPKKTEYEFCGKTFPIATPKLLFLTFLVGIVGGAYGIGGGSIIAPFCVAFFGLPVYMIAGAALLSTFLTSIAGVLFYTLVPLKQGISTSPDWLLGILFGLGGLVGMYCGARLQKHMPQKFINVMSGIMLCFCWKLYQRIFRRLAYPVRRLNPFLKKPGHKDAANPPFFLMGGRELNGPSCRKPISGEIPGPAARGWQPNFHGPRNPKTMTDQRFLRTIRTMTLVRCSLAALVRFALSLSPKSQATSKMSQPHGR